MAEPIPNERTHEYIATTREHFALYHNHKEYMAYVLLTLYLAGISILAANDIPWQKIYAFCIMPWVTIGVACVFGRFILWQLQMRTAASIMVSACDHMRVQLLAQPTRPLNHLPVYHQDMYIPDFLRDAVRNVPSPPFKQRLLLSGTPILLLSTWHVLLLWRVVVAYQVPISCYRTCIFPFSIP